MNTRDVSLTIGGRAESEPYHVKLTHKPSGKYAEATGDTFEAAKSAAWASLAGSVDIPATIGP